jgi:hypothetical protein
MWKRTASLTVFLGLLVTVACDDSDKHALEPTPLSSSVSTSVSVQPSTVAAESVSPSFCPSIPPFTGSIDLNVRATSLGVFVQQVQMTFFDNTGATAPAVTLPAPVPTQQFGSTLIAARSQRTFPIRFAFGCGTMRTGTLVVVVVLKDEQSRQTTTEARVTVR